MKKFLLVVYLSFLFPVGEAGAIFLLIAPGASAAGTGEAQVARADDAYASYYNPAGLGFQNRAGMAGMHVNWLPNLADDLYYEFLAYKQPLSAMDGTIGGHLIFLNLGEQMGMDEMGNETGQFKSYMWAFALSYGTMISKNSSVGINFKVFHQKLADSGTGSESGDPFSTDFAFDVGYLKKFNNGFNFGVAIQNIGPPIDFVDADQADPAPTNLRLGFQKEFIINEYNKINLLFDVNRLLVARYPSMDWNGDGIIQNNDKEPGFTDPWYKAIFTCWLDDWYYDYDRDYDGDGVIGGYEEVEGQFLAFGYPEAELGEDLDNFVFGYDQSGSPCTIQNDDMCSQNASGNNFYNNGYNLTNISFQDGADTFNDENNDGMWNPPEPFFDHGDQVWEEFNGHSTDLDDYNWEFRNGNYWIYYNTFDSQGAIVMVNVEVDPNDPDDFIITGADYGDGVRNEDEEFMDWNGDILYTEGEAWTEDDNGNGTFDTGYSSSNSSGEKEVGSGKDYSFEDELKELISNIGLEYWYTDNFVLRAGYIYDREGKIMNPTFGAGVRFGQYGFDFGYTAGDPDHARANTMFFSINMDL